VRFFGVSQTTVSRRWDLLRPVIGDVLAEFIPTAARSSVRDRLVDGTICPTWDWRHIPDLFSAKAGYVGINIQIRRHAGRPRWARTRSTGPATMPTPSLPLA
jgi:hypothetical protein